MFLLKMFHAALECVLVPKLLDARSHEIIVVRTRPTLPGSVVLLCGVLMQQITHMVENLYRI